MISDPATVYVTTHPVRLQRGIWYSTTVQHKRLLTKLDYYGVRWNIIGLDWRISKQPQSKGPSKWQGF